VEKYDKEVAGNSRGMAAMTVTNIGHE